VFMGSNVEYIPSIHTAVAGGGGLTVPTIAGGLQLLHFICGRIRGD